MGRAPCCDKEGLKRGPWTPEEDKILVDYIKAHGHGSWRSLPKLAGLLRCGKSCRLRWTNYLRPDIKRGPFTQEEQKSIIQLHAIVGNKWSTIAAQLPGRTDNEIKNYWNTHLKKRLLKAGIDLDTSAPTNVASSPSPLAGTPSSPTSVTPLCSATRHMAQWESARLEAEARLSKESLLFSSSSSVTASTAAATSSPQPKQDIPKQETDFFLRIWNSEVGESFRRREAVSSSSSSRLFTVKEEDEAGTGETGASTTEGGEDVECKNSMDGFGGSDSWSSNEAAEESYQLYLDFAAGDDMVSLFQSNLSSLSLFSSDLSELGLTDPSPLV